MMNSLTIVCKYCNTHIDHELYESNDADDDGIHVMIGYCETCHPVVSDEEDPDDEDFLKNTFE